MLKLIKNRLLALHHDDRGAMSVEKVLILAVIALPILIVLFLFKNRIIEYFNGQASQLPTG